MIDDELERDVLARARGGLSPSVADQARVRGAVAKRIALGALGSPAAGSSTNTPDGQLGELTRDARRWLSRLGVALAVAAGSGTGYFFGHRAGVEAGRAQPRPHSNDSPQRVPAEIDERAPAAPAVPTRAVEAHESPPPRVATVHRPAVSAETEDAGLDAEVRLLRRVELALRDRNPRFALGLLGELERTIPGGQLAEERQAARVMARCQLEGGSRSLAKEFAAGHPGSAYTSRVEETCRESNEQRNPEGADTHP